MDEFPPLKESTEISRKIYKLGGIYFRLILFRGRWIRRECFRDERPGPQLIYCPPRKEEQPLAVDEEPEQEIPPKNNVEEIPPPKRQRQPSPPIEPEVILELLQKNNFFFPISYYLRKMKTNPKAIECLIHIFSYPTCRSSPKQNQYRSNIEPGYIEKYVKGLCCSDKRFIDVLQEKGYILNIKPFRKNMYIIKTCQ